MTRADDRPDHLTWYKSSHSGGSGECVEIARDGQTMVWVRDSKDASGPWLSFPTGTWHAFVHTVQNEFSLTD